MSQEEASSQSSTEPFSWLASDDPESREVEVITEDTENYEWDNYRENPSFVTQDPVEDLEAEPAVVQAGRRVSSTDDQFLESESLPTLKPFVFDHNQDNQYSVWPPRHPSSEGEILFEESLLPRGLLASIEETETEDDVFFDTANLVEEIMPPKAAPTPAQLFDSFEEKVEEFNDIAKIVEQTGKPPDSDTLGELDDLNKAIRKLVNDMKKADSNYETAFPDVGTKKTEVYLSLIKLRQAREEEKETVAETDSTEVNQEETNVAVSSLTTEFSTWEEELSSIDKKLLKLYTDTPEPHSFEATETSKLLDDIRAVEESAKPLYIRLVVEVSKLKEEKKTEKLEKAKADWSKLQENVSLLTRKGQEYLSKYTPPAPAPSSNPTQTPNPVHTRSTPLKRLNLPTFSGNKADYLCFKKEFEKHVRYETEDEKLMALKTECAKQLIRGKFLMNQHWMTASRSLTRPMEMSTHSWRRFFRTGRT